MFSAITTKATSSRSLASRLVLFAAKLGISGLLLAWLFYQTSWQELAGIWVRIEWGPAMFGLLLYFVNLLISSVRWRMIARLEGFKEKQLGAYLRLTLIGAYFSLLLPTSVGGDAVKAYYLAQGWKHYPRALVTVVIDRLSGLWLLMAASGFAAMLIDFPALPDSVRYGAVFLSAVSLATVIFLPRMSARFKSYLPDRAVAKYTRDPQVWLPLMLLVVVVQLSGAWMYLMIAKSLGVDLSWSFLIVFYILTVLVTVLPVTLNGIGLREGAAVFLLSQLHLPASVGIAFGLTYLLIMAATGAIGGFIYFTLPRAERVRA